jgi:hypothetical protein
MAGTPTPDTFFVTGLTQQQLLASQIYVTPTGGTQTTLAQALANGANGGLTLSGSGFTANAAIGTLPANAIITSIIFRETAGVGVNVSLGTTSGGTQVLSAQAVAASGTLTLLATAFTENWFSAVATQLLYLNSASWGGASINVQLVYVIGP